MAVLAGVWIEFRSARAGGSPGDETDSRRSRSFRSCLPLRQQPTMILVTWPEAGGSPSNLGRFCAPLDLRSRKRRITARIRNAAEQAARNFSSRTTPEARTKGV